MCSIMRFNVVARSSSHAALLRNARSVCVHIFTEIEASPTHTYTHTHLRSSSFSSAHTGTFSTDSSTEELRRCSCLSKNICVGRNISKIARWNMNIDCAFVVFMSCIHQYAVSTHKYVSCVMYYPSQICVIHLCPSLQSSANIPHARLASSSHAR